MGIQGEMMKEKKPYCFGDFKKVEASKCNGCKFVLSCYVEWGRKEKMRRAEERRSAPKNMKLFLRERKPFQRDCVRAQLSLKRKKKREGDFFLDFSTKILNVLYKASYVRITYILMTDLK